MSWWVVLLGVDYEGFIISVDRVLVVKDREKAKDMARRYVKETGRDASVLRVDEVIG